MGNVEPLKTTIILGLLIVSLVGCASYKATEPEKGQLYLAMLLQMQADRCNLNESECHKKFQDWKNSDFGKDIIGYYEDLKNKIQVLTPHLHQATDSVFCESDCKKRGTTLLNITQSPDFELSLQHAAVQKARENIR